MKGVLELNLQTTALVFLAAMNGFSLKLKEAAFVLKLVAALQKTSSLLILDQGLLMMPIYSNCPFFGPKIAFETINGVLVCIIVS